MPHHQETRILPYTAEEMYAVVADIERYPEFLPWCAQVTVRKREAERHVELITAAMRIAFHAFHERYVSLVRLDRRALTIDARHVEGPFQRLDTRWRFVPLGAKSEVHFLIDFAFKSMLLSAVAGVAFGFVAAKMAEAFVQRAHVLYGASRIA
ncbi:MAG: coenzyme Q-binding protein [Alphaproteobacteria bacterium]|jgi:coenzyme Q-binding protein COQ10|nr:coenzyme Q-binding protein [Alphaproteobacteria bacterium]